MKKKDIVQKQKDFNTIIENNKFLKSDFFVIYLKKKETENPKYGIAAGKKLGNAVLRNKLKRQYRRIIDNNKFLFPKYTDYIIMVKKASLTATFTQMNDCLRNLLESVKE